MSSIPCIFLPGLDGAADLMVCEFGDLSPDGYSLLPVSLPDDPSLNYDGLCDHVGNFLNQAGACEPFQIIAESFSGPLAILLAHRYPQQVRGLTLVANFAASPAPWFARYLPWNLIFRRELPDFVARYFFGADPNLAKRLRESIRFSSPETLLHRIQCILNVDVTEELSELKCPIDYIRPIHDRLVQKQSLSTIVASNPNVNVHEIAGSHLIIQTQPQQVWDCIRNAEDIH